MRESGSRHAGNKMGSYLSVMHSENPITAVIAGQWASYERDLTGAPERLRKGKLKVGVPKAVEPHRKRPGAHFHLTMEFFVQTGGVAIRVPAGCF